MVGITLKPGSAPVLGEARVSIGVALGVSVSAAVIWLVSLGAGVNVAVASGGTVSVGAVVSLGAGVLVSVGGAVLVTVGEGRLVSVGTVVSLGADSAKLPPGRESPGVSLGVGCTSWFTGAANTGWIGIPPIVLKNNVTIIHILTARRLKKRICRMVVSF
jgi:hypothetical protein